MNLNRLTESEKIRLIEAYENKDFQLIAEIIIKGGAFDGCPGCSFSKYIAAEHIEKLKDERKS